MRALMLCYPVGRASLKRNLWGERTEAISSREKFNTGTVEARLERAAAVWRRRCQGASMPTLAREFDISLSTVHDYIEEQRKLLRTETIDLAAQEREQALVFLDTALEEVMPHISNGDAIKIQRVRHGARHPSSSRWRHGRPK